MNPTEAARLAAILPLPKERGAISPKGFTRRYGNSIAARLAVVARDRLDTCVYAGTVPPPAREPPSRRKPIAVPGSDYESAAPVPVPAPMTREPASSGGPPQPEPPPQNDLPSAPVVRPSSEPTATDPDVNAA